MISCSCQFAQVFDFNPVTLGNTSTLKVVSDLDLLWAFGRSYNLQCVCDLGQGCDLERVLWPWAIFLTSQATRDGTKWRRGKFPEQNSPERKNTRHAYWKWPKICAYLQQNVESSKVCIFDQRVGFTRKGKKSREEFLRIIVLLRILKFSRTSHLKAGLSKYLSRVRSKS